MEFREGVIVLKRIQNKLVRMLPGMECFTFGNRLDKLGLLLLVTEKTEEALIEV